LTLYDLQFMLRSVIVDWTDEFNRWLDHAEEQDGRLLVMAVALLQALSDLPASRPGSPRLSSGSARPGGMSSGGLPIHLTPTSLSVSSAGSPPMTRL
jgi:hypothetical protein